MIDSVTGRGHALCDLFLRGSTTRVYYGPGHHGLDDPRVEQVPSISLSDPATVVEFCSQVDVDFVFVSWIDSLADGYADALRAAGLRVVGPGQQAAELEASKSAGKRFCAEHGIPVAAWTVSHDPADTLDVLRRHEHPVVVKEDGLTAVSDGAHICWTLEESAAAVRRIADRTGDTYQVVVEEYVRGIDVSVSALVSGTDFTMLPSALDYKRVNDGDQGGNCDGMGTVAPHPAHGDQLQAQARDIVAAITAAMASSGMHYVGFLYVGCMLVDDRLLVLEINTRLGDSEAQALLPGVRSDLHLSCQAALDGRLSETPLVHDGRTRCCVAVTQGYVPGTDADRFPGWPHGPFVAGQEVSGLDRVDTEVARVFFGGAERDPSGSVVSRAGRVLFLVAEGAGISDAAARAYRELANIWFPGIRYRRDIGRGL